ncbi:uncharacterized protein LOC143300037 [Babylonia areolata]|uniref:uncharacterized protein LOC143300037 n=1 Tax=Babylonia areolata TaxID=304850 RepID=UPI003FD4D144
MVKDKEAERERQERLARERLEAARLRKKDGQGQVSDRQLEVIAQDAETETDRSKLQEMALTALDLKHQAERELLITLLEEKATGGHRDAGRNMTTEDLTARLQDARDVFWQWNNSGKTHSDGGDESLQLLREAVAYTSELRRRQMESSGKPSSEGDVQVSLLADLQQMQGRESSDTLTSAMDMERLGTTGGGEGGGGGDDNDDDDDEEGLTEEEKEERRVVKALEMKYDALRDKVIIEALIQQYGEVEWKRLSELERQRKVAELKRKERQLRHEGKMDEIEALLGQHLKHKQVPSIPSADLDAMLGESQQEQKRRLEERLARRRQLKAEREAEGLVADDTTLDAIQQKEEEEQKEESTKRRNVLDNLQMHFEDEKAALLSTLSRHSDEAQREKERQNALVRLQRDRKRLQAEEKLDSAALIFGMAKQQHEDRQESLLRERDRQRQLAKERLMQRRRQVLEGRQEPAGEDKLMPIVEEDVPENTLASDMQQLQEGVLMAFDKHQAAERDTLQLLLARCRRDTDGAKKLKALSDEELRLRMTRSEKEYAAWKKESAKKVAALEDPNLPAKRRQKVTQKAVQRWQAQQDILGQALALKLELERRQLAKLRGDSTEAAVWEELCVITLASLQERQMIVFNTQQESIFTKTEEELKEMRKAQRVASREGWFESLSALAFSVEDMSGEVVSLSDRQASEAKLQEEFMQQKKAALEKAQREGLDPEAMLRDLEEQFAAKKKKLNEDMERQRSEVMQRLEVRRQRQTDRSFETEAVVQMLKDAESQSRAAQDRAAAEQGNQRSLLQERLQQRREARKRAAVVGTPRSVTPWSRTESPMLDGLHRSDSSSSLGLRREKSLVDAMVSDDQKQAIYNQLVKQQLNEQFSKTAQRQRQEEELKRRLEARKGKRDSEVAALFSLGERQKTFLEQAKKGEQERQIAQMRDRVSRAKFERTRKLSSQSLVGKGFAEQALEEGDETMEDKARTLQEQFQREAEKARAEQASQSAGSGQAAQTVEKSRMDILKERRKQKKLQRQEKD